MLQSSKDLNFAIIITTVVFLVELVGGYISGSLALISDSFHMFVDVFALTITYVSLTIAQSLPTKARTFGLHRAEILAALFNGLLLLGITSVIIFKAVARIFSPTEIHTVQLLGFACIGLLANLLIIKRLVHYKDINLKGAFLHVLSDTLSSFAVVIGAVIMYFTGFTKIDSIISIIIAVIIVYTAVHLVSEALHILLQSVPKGIDLDIIVKEVKKIPSVESIHSIQIWSLCSNVNVMTAHVLTSANNLLQSHILAEKITKKLKKYNIKHTTFQFEFSACKINGKLRKVKH